MLMIPLLFQFLPLVPRRTCTYSFTSSGTSSCVPPLTFIQQTSVPSSSSRSSATLLSRTFTALNSSHSSYYNSGSVNSNTIGNTSSDYSKSSSNHKSNMNRHSSSSSSSSFSSSSLVDYDLTNKLCQSIIDSSSCSPTTVENEKQEHQKKQTQQKHSIKLSFAIAGGGSKAISSLASTPGASSVLQNGSILYDRISFCQYISQHLTSRTSIPPFVNSTHSRLPLEHYYSFSSASSSGATDTSADPSSASSSSSSSSSSLSFPWMNLRRFGFASRGSAILLSQAALHHSYEQCWSLGDMLHQSVAVGCTSTLVSHGRENRVSRVHIGLLKGDGRGVLWDVKMGGSSDSTNSQAEKEVKELMGQEGDYSSKKMEMTTSTTTRRRNRREEEEVVAQLILLCVNRFARSESGQKYGDHSTIDVKDILSRDGDEWHESTFSLSASEGDESSLEVQGAAQRILDDHVGHVHDLGQKQFENRTDAIVLVPFESSSFSMVPLVHTVLPPDPLILPGSFNPPHMGHVALANAAIRAMTRKKILELKQMMTSLYGNSFDDDINGNNSSNCEEDDMSSILDAMWSTTEYQTFQDYHQQKHNNHGQEEQSSQGPFTVLFEMSLTNADKPPMESNEASRRVSLFGDLVEEMDAAVQTKQEGSIEHSSSSNMANGSQTMPKDWGVLLTNAPLFREKVRVLQKYLAPSNGSGGMVTTRKMTFVIGTDTMVRILHPKYYGDRIENVIEALREMKREGVHFVVGGRLEQIKNPDGTMSKEAKFVTGEHELKHLPDDVVDMFTMIQEKDFRVDISSTELRARQQSRCK